MANNVIGTDGFLTAPEGRVVVAMMARAPWLPGKSRLADGLSVGEHLALREALFDDSLDVVCRVGQVARAVVCDPPEACAALRQRVPTGVSVMPQGSGDLGTRMADACLRLFALGARGVVLVGSDTPDLPASRIREAVARLTTNLDQVVLGPAADGGYYLIGLGACHMPLFAGIDWGTSRVREQTLDRARASGLTVVELALWADVDTHADLARVAASRTRSARRTRACIRALRQGSSGHGVADRPPR